MFVAVEEVAIWIEENDNFVQGKDEVIRGNEEGDCGLKGSE